nr:EOG090X0IJO [Ilyocryptus agilis]
MNKKQSHAAANLPLRQTMRLFTLIFDKMKHNTREVVSTVRSKEVLIDQGMSLLDVKNQLLLKYLMNLSFVLLKKISGECIKGSACIDRLVEIRTIIERMRPLEHKLKYQIEKLLKLASTGKFAEGDPLQFKASPGNLISKIGDDLSDEEASDKKDKKTGVYVPPKLVAMQYDGDETNEERTSKASEKSKRHAFGKSVLQSLREEYMDSPMEIVESSANGGRLNMARERQERKEYEETYFTRLPYTSKDRQNARQQFSSKALANELSGMGSSAERGKTKRKFNGKKKGGFKKRKH